jgi:hypothetical protein
MNRHTAAIRKISIAMLVPFVGLLTACGSSSHTGGTVQAAAVKGPSEVLAERTSSTGRNPFMPAVGGDEPGVQPPRAAANPSGGVATYVGNLPGLYGGTRHIATCDAGLLVSFLEQHSDKAAAWAATLRVNPSQIRAYVSGLTPVILRTDTRVTNHGFVDGQANPIQSVLEAGTAVFVDKYGEPVVKCYCGNPLTPPVTYSAPTYTGPIWPRFEPSHITIIQQSTTIINEFTLYDPANGKYFTRRAGNSSSHDGPYQTGPSATRGTGTSATPSQPGPTSPSSAPPTSTAPQPTVTGQPSPSSQPTENPSASFSPNPGHQGDTFTLSASGFAPAAHVDVTLTRPDGAVEHYTISIGSDGTGTYTFTNTSNVITGTYSATLANAATGAQAQASVDVLPASAQTPTTTQ